MARLEIHRRDGIRSRRDQVAPHDQSEEAEQNDPRAVRRSINADAAVDIGLRKQKFEKRQSVKNPEHQIVGADQRANAREGFDGGSARSATPTPIAAVSKIDSASVEGRASQVSANPTTMIRVGTAGLFGTAPRPR